MTKAISYVRWSHPNQTEGDSLERQSKGFEKFCKDHNLTPCEVYVDEGVSGWKSANAEQQLGQVLKDIKTGKIEKGSVLVIEQLDRLSRDDVDIALGLVGKILRSGVHIGHIRANQILTIDKFKGFGGMQFLVELILANEESNKKSERITAALDRHKENARKEKKPWTKTCPGWLALTEDRKKYRKEKEEVAKVKYIFKLCIDGLGSEAIAKRLNKEGAKPIGKANRWNRSYVNSILHNRQVLGEYQPQKLVGPTKKRVDDGPAIPGYFPAIVTEEVFYKAQAAIEARRRSPGPTSKFVNLFGGLCHEKKTGSTMWVRSVPQKDGSMDKALYPNEAANVAGRSWSIRMSLLEPALLMAIWELELEITPSQDQEKLEGLKAKAETLASRIDRKTDEMVDEDEEEKYDSMEALVKKLEDRKKETEAKIEKLAAKISENPEDNLSSAKTAIEALLKAKKKDLEDLRKEIRAKIRTLIERIDLSKVKDGWIKAEIKFKGEKHTRRVMMSPERKGFTVTWTNEPKFCELRNVIHSFFNPL